MPALLRFPPPLFILAAILTLPSPINGSAQERVRVRFPWLPAEGITVHQVETQIDPPSMQLETGPEDVEIDDDAVPTAGRAGRLAAIGASPPPVARTAVVGREGTRVQSLQTPVASAEAPVPLTELRLTPRAAYREEQGYLTFTGGHYNPSGNFAFFQGEEGQTQLWIKVEADRTYVVEFSVGLALSDLVNSFTVGGSVEQQFSTNAPILVAIRPSQTGWTSLSLRGDGGAWRLLSAEVTRL